ncbi:amidohydrolase family protein [Prosthecodimorpha staleyi]|uniref:Amidohydrolase family protein n=1 Tax=Prosthecodimorpha staleyi TaxID=2840188 RepID=A0A947D377_9HYPH|nr:amidohydrolase family protein [Prosthecodimorpha staleyi]MBT9290175.1 amidohydrolase family protein [Prosthecodimorpha staleyi]
MSHDLFIRNVRPMARSAADVHVQAGRIAAIGPDLPVPAGVEVLDGAGAILTPGLVEAHTHLDKSLWGMGWRPHDAGPRLIDKIDNERRLKKLINIDPARQSARQVVQSSRMGSTAIRSHVDVDTEIGLWGMEGVLKTRADYADIMDIDIVAFPQSGLMIRPGTAELLDQAMKMGADVVGGLDPCAIDRDPKGQLDVVFGLAERYGKPVDIHLHEGGTMGAFSMELIIERTRALGMAGKVTVSHAFCLGDPDPALVDPLIAALAELDIAIMTTGPASRPAPPVAKLAAAGVRLCSGSDGIRDTWGPYGNADMLERAMFLGLRNNFRKDEEVELAFDVVTHGGARVMDLAGYGLDIGCVADLLIVPGAAITEAVVSRPANRIVIKRGRVVARDGAVLREAP